MAAADEPNSYAAHLQEKHRRFGTPREVVAKAMLDGIGAEPAALQRLALGEVNEVYDVLNRDGRQVIVRISHRGSSAFHAERWALARCGAAGVPVPRVLSLQTVSTEAGSLTVCIEEKLPGTPLQQLINAGLGRERVAAVIGAAGALLARIHTVPLAGWGNFDGRGRTQHRSWRDFLLEMLPPQERVLPTFVRHGAGAETVAAAFAVASGPLPGVEPEYPCLVHTDFAPKHLLLSGDRITGVLDMENSIGGDPQWDLAAWEYWFSDSLPLTWLLHGYGSESAAAGAASRRLVYRLILGLSAHDWYATEQSEPGLAITARWLTRDVTLLTR